MRNSLRIWAWVYYSNEEDDGIYMNCFEIDIEHIDLTSKTSNINKRIYETIFLGKTFFLDSWAEYPEKENTQTITL